VYRIIGGEVMWNNEDEVRNFLCGIGEDPGRDGLRETPARVVKAFNFLLSGYGVDVSSVLKSFDSDGYNQIVLLKNIELYSLCEHHILPFFGRAHVAYIPGKKIIGISKLARVVDVFSRRLQIQERIGEQVTGALEEFLHPKGVACIIEAEHLCMRMRGVEKQNSVMVTSSLKGLFLEGESRLELLKLIYGG
jgi:GTP cyclohydrolase IA